MTWLADSHCKACKQPYGKFNSQNSTTFRQLTPKIAQTIYGKGSILGWNAQDKICTMDNRCANTKFNIVAYQEKLSQMKGQGLIGLAPRVLDQSSELFTDSLGVKKFAVNYPAR